MIRKKAAPPPIEFGDLTATALSPREVGRPSMEIGTLGARAPGGKPGLPASRAACRAEIDQLRGEIDAIQAQIATADLERQAKRGKMDPRWYHRARTAIRHKRQQIATLTAHMQGLPSERRAGFKDCLIEVLRVEYDDETWGGFLDRAHALHAHREGA